MWRDRWPGIPLPTGRRQRRLLGPFSARRGAGLQILSDGPAFSGRAGRVVSDHAGGFPVAGQPVNTISKPYQLGKFAVRKIRRSARGSLGPQSTSWVSRAHDFLTSTDSEIFLRGARAFTLQHPPVQRVEDATQRIEDLSDVPDPPTSSGTGKAPVLQPTEARLHYTYTCS